MRLLFLLFIVWTGCGSEPTVSETEPAPSTTSTAPSASTASTSDPWRGHTVCELVPDAFFATLTGNCSDRITPVGDTNKYEGRCLSGCESGGNPVSVLMKPVKNMDRILASVQEEAAQSEALQIVEVPGADIATFYPSDRQTTFYAENFRITVVAPMTPLDDAAVRIACGTLVTSVREKLGR